MRFARVASVLVVSLFVPLSIAACGKASVPEVPKAPLPEPRTVDAEVVETPEASVAVRDAQSADVKSMDAGQANVRDAAPGDASDASVDAAPPPSFVGPLRDEADAVARAARAADIALEKAYAAFVKRQQISPSHSGSWAANGHREVKGSITTGYVVTFESHPPAGFDYVAVVQVGARGEISVKRVEVTFSPD